ncbi:MAG: PQQ-like beta-propeller repeat protein, partial [Rhodospirillales bacterium]|nr:PQQ-like beta-propeller repeat protein [Rhodospirillales bacterium]
MKRIATVFLVTLTLSACDTWFGEVETPLPGDRISVLLHERTLTPDSELAGHEILLPPPTPNPEWPQDGGYANHAMHHIEVSENLVRAWTLSIGQGADDEVKLTTAPIAAGGRLFTMDTEATISAFDLQSGKGIWRVELMPENDDGHFGGGLAHEDGIVFVATGFAKVFALKAETGEIVWKKDMSAPMRSAPTVRGNRLFVSTVDNIFSALDARNGNELWRHDGVAEGASLLGRGSPAVDSGVVVAAFPSGEIIAFKVENGRPLWDDNLTAKRRNDPLASLADIRGRPVIDRGLVF